ASTIFILSIVVNKEETKVKPCVLSSKPFISKPDISLSDLFCRTHARVIAQNLLIIDGLMNPYLSRPCFSPTAEINEYLMYQHAVKPKGSIKVGWKFLERVDLGLNDVGN